MLQVAPSNKKHMLPYLRIVISSFKPPGVTHEQVHLVVPPTGAERASDDPNSTAERAAMPASVTIFEQDIVSVPWLSARIIPIAGAGTLAQRCHRSCEAVHWRQQNRTFCDGHHSRQHRQTGVATLGLVCRARGVASAPFA
jgi:hypothetical protein